MGSAELAEAHVDERPAAPPAWSGTDPTPTPSSTAVVQPPRGHVHWAWVPTISIVVLALAVTWYGLTH